MAEQQPTASLSLATVEGADPELESLPEPRRPGRNITIVAMAVTGVASLALAASLLGEGLYALQGGQPTDVGDLSRLPLDGSRASWIRGEALLGHVGAIRYDRPLERDTFRLAPVNGNDRLWVEIRVPAGFEGPYFVPPTSFVGRLLPLSERGLRHLGLPSEVQHATGRSLSPDSWLLIDGESPASLRWAIGVFLLLVAFAAFNAYGLYRLLRPVRDD
ncbi:MAG: hypothetical protein JW751_15720 [Polyangiaceae bacterium]|nr:hypothetical protein [Polyangiaceae bacterium]